jgi:predicted TPR repeat methyltransferase
MAWEKKGKILTKLGRTAEAIASYNTVLELDPDNSNAKEKLKLLTSTENQ